MTNKPMTFKDYLHKKKLSPKTIISYQKQLENFTDWMEQENLQLNELAYTDLLKYISHLRQKSWASRTISHQLGIIRHYFDYKATTGEISANPAQNLTLKGITKSIPTDLLSEKELNAIYQGYKPKHESYKIMLGLLIYQALTLGELEKLKPENLKLTEGKIYIPGSRKSNGRWLELKPFQILVLHDYVKLVEKDKPLFTGKRSSQKLGNTLVEIFREVKKLNPKAKYALQIRSSVITNKLKTSGLREVQYFAGHRYVSSTERYKLGNIENLKKQINKHHPLNTKAYE
jgi:integrase/recombinase XerD